MIKHLLLLSIILLTIINVHAQLLINEASNRNYRQVLDEDGEYNDWIELYNSGNNSLDLSGWSLSDNRNVLDMWTFAPVVLNPHDFVLVHASAKDRNQLSASLEWGSLILQGDEFKYLVPDDDTPLSWKNISYNDASWQKGKTGIGYGDGDDLTTVPEGTTVVFMRRQFQIDDVEAIHSIKLFMDFDDGFVAYINGFEIARANVDGTPTWNATANNNHEATVYSGGSPEEFSLNEEQVLSILKNGNNVLAVASLNVGNTSSDFSMAPNLLIGSTERLSIMRDLPNWYLRSAPGNLHTNFKLKSEGEKIYLSNQGVLIDSLDVDGLLRNMSIGRTTDGSSQIGIFTSATPGASNNTSQAYTSGFTAMPKFDLDPGFYTKAINVTLSIKDDQATIRYTLDGSEPTEESPIYNNSIRIASTKCLRVRAFNPGQLPSEVNSATYFIREEEYTLPILSVIASNDDIFGSEGIFTNWQQTFDIPAYMEFYESSGVLAFRQNAGMQVDGGAGGSRSISQHSFRMEPGNSVLGDGDVKYPMMHRRPNRTNFPSFYVRNGSNQYLTLPYKDGLEVTALGRNTYTYYSAYQPIIVYINGEFFGVYELREKINDDYLVDNYDMNIDSLDFLGVSYFKGQKLEALRGSVDPFYEDLEHFRTLNANDEDYLEDVDEFLDVKSYTDYIIAESWVGNNDWPNNNIKLFRCLGTELRWQWAINDLEWALNPNGWTNSSFDHISFMLSQGINHNFVGFWNRMMSNTEYKSYFINRFADLMNTSYDFSVIGPLENEMFNEINAEMDHEYERWTGSDVEGRMTTFNNNHEVFRSELSERSNHVREHLESHFNLQRQVVVNLEVEPQGAGVIQISTITPNNYPWSGIYFGQVEINIKAIPNPGYEFIGWDPDTFIKDVSSAELSGIFRSSKANFKAYFKESNTIEAQVVISEINYKQGGEIIYPDWIEICNYSGQTVDLKDWYFTDSGVDHRFTFDESVVLQNKQRIVLSNDLAMFKYAYPKVNVYPVEFDFGLGTPDDVISLYNKTGELVFQVAYSDNYPWPLNDDFDGRSLELRSFTGNYNSASSWFKGCIGGSPGSSYQYCEEQQVSVPELTLADIDISFYPNPAYDYLTSSINLQHDVPNCTIVIYNMAGKEIIKEELGELSAGNYSHIVDLSQVKPQLLLLKISTGREEKVFRVLKVQ